MDFNEKLLQQINHELLICFALTGKSIQKSLHIESSSALCKGLSEEIFNKTYTPSEYCRFAVTDPKLREIYAPSYRDRLVQCWIVYHLNPFVERNLIDDTFSNRKYKGTLAAVKRVQRFMRQPGNVYYLQLDIQNFFNSIPLTPLFKMFTNLLDRYFTNHLLYEHLKYILEKCILHPVALHTHACSGDYKLLRGIPPHKTLAGAKHLTGIPLGSAASQMFANLWLSPLDHYIKHTLKIKGYVRYMDDLFLLGSCTSQLSNFRRDIGTFCKKNLHLTLHPTKQSLQKCTQGADYLGYYVYPHYLHFRKRNITRIIQWLHFFNALLNGKEFRNTFKTLNTQNWPVPRSGICVTPDYLLLKRMQAVINSYFGMMKHAQHWRLRRTIWHKHSGVLTTWFLPSGPDYSSVRIKKYYLQDWIAQQYRQ